PLPPFPTRRSSDLPWPALASALGVDGDAVTTTLLRTCEYIDNRHTNDARHLLADIADTIGRSGSWIFQHAGAGVILCPEHAQLLAGAGYSREDVQRELAERSGRTTAALATAGKDFAEHGVRRPGDGTGDPDSFQ